MDPPTPDSNETDAMNFLLGFSNVLTGQDLASDISGCVMGAFPVLNDLQTALADLKEESLDGFKAALEVLKTTVDDLAAAVTQCQPATVDVEDLEQKLKLLGEDLVSARTNYNVWVQNLLANHDNVYNSVEAALNAKKFR